MIRSTLSALALAATLALTAVPAYAAPTPTPATTATPIPTATPSPALRSQAATPVPTRTGQPRQTAEPTGTAEATPTSTPTPTPTPAHPVDAKYAELGGAGGFLGQPTTGLYCGLRDNGCFRHYQGGSIYWTQQTGAHFTRGLIKDLWARQGWETGELGYPTSDEQCASHGCSQAFAGGEIYYSPSAGTHAVTRRVRGSHLGSGGVTGVLGYPTGDLNCGLVRGGCFQNFQRGAIYWSPETGSQWTKGLIAEKWGSMGWETGFLGYPTSDEQCWIAGGCFQNFQGGKIYWSLNTGAHFVRGSIFDRWGQLGWENGFGFPTSDENCGLRDRGCFQTFTKGAIYWSPGTGAQEVRGEIANHWGRNGWENGHLGYPISGEFCGLRAGGCGQRFQNGSIYWSPRTGAHFVKGAIRDEWGLLGWEEKFGYPVTDEICGLKGGGCRQVFEGNDHIYFSPQIGAGSVPREFMDAWGRYGWETGRLGYPYGWYVENLPDGRKEYGVEYQGGWIYYQFTDWNNLGPAQYLWR